MGGGYTRKTTFYSDLSIAELDSVKAIKDTYKNVCKNWIDNVEYFTEFVLCLNYKSWEMYEIGNVELSKLYSDLYYKAQDKFYEYYEGNQEALDYYFQTTD